MKIQYTGSPIGSIATLSKCLDVSEESLRLIAIDSENQYSISEIPKKKSGFREISDPLPHLKKIQRRIVRRIFSNVKFPAYLFGSIKDDENPRDFLRNAQAHLNAKEVLSFDIDSFFPSCQPRYIYKIYHYLFKFPRDVADILVRLTTLNGGLPQGAPTSSYLANLLFYDNEHALCKTLKDKGFTYTRLVDDIVISSRRDFKPGEKSFVYQSILRLLKDKGLKLNKEKYASTNTGTQGKRTIITGVQVRNGQLNLPHEKVAEIKNKIYRVEMQGAADTTDPHYHKIYASASGLVALYRRIDPKKADLLRSRIRYIKPTYHQQRIKTIKWVCNKLIRYAKENPRRMCDYSYAKKYHRLMHKIAIIRRTNRRLAINLKMKLGQVKPTYLLSEYEP